MGQTSRCGLAFGIATCHQVRFRGRVQVDVDRLGREDGNSDFSFPLTSHAMTSALSRRKTLGSQSHMNRFSPPRSR